MLRGLFLEDVIHEIDLGSYRGTRRAALIARINGQPEVFLEHRRTGGIDLFHLPSDGLENLEEVGRALLSDPTPVRPTLGERIVRLGFWLIQLLVVVWLLPAFYTFFAVMSSDTFPTTQTFWVFLMFLSIAALYWGYLGAVALVHGEPLGLARVRCALGAPSPIRPLGTYQGGLGKKGFFVRTFFWVRLHVAALRNRSPSLVMTRLHVAPMSFGVATYGIPVAQVAPLLQVLATYRGLVEGSPGR